MNGKMLSRCGSCGLFAAVFLSTAPAVTLAAPPASQPLFEQIQDVNPCTDRIITLTFTGTAVTRTSGDHFILRAGGTVVTSDGYEGSFNLNFVVIGDRVETLRFHDTELSDAGGQRIVFAAQPGQSTRPIIERCWFKSGSGDHRSHWACSSNW
jgi:hypothetical protein